MQLSALPETFGLPDLEKGMFPHFFNTKDNWNYDGALPPKEAWSPKTMKSEERKEFEDWYEKQRKANKRYNFKEEIVKYCRKDVEILREACISFRKLNMDISGICPFSECTTLASLSMRTFRKMFLKENMVGIIPREGYRFCRNQSKCAIEWLMWLEYTENIDIVHAGKAREYILPTTNIELDGYRENQTGQKYAYQFQGCYWHGCPVCYTTERDKRIHENDTLNTRFEKTLVANAVIREKGFILREMWECEFNTLKKHSLSLQEFVTREEICVRIPLNRREAFFGGRTGNIVSHYDCQPGEKINYYDVCSLYPFVCKTGIFPVGHPQVIVGAAAIERLCGSNNDISNVEGLIKCTVLPPLNLFHPVLPVKANNKLMFPLCAKCCQEMFNGECRHTDSECALTGTWVSCELKKAVHMGYKIIIINSEKED